MREIIIKNANKYYKNIQALNDVSFTIKENEVMGIIGPNGAGKTTLIESMLGLRTLDSGSISIFGHDVVKDHKQLVYIVGAQMQENEINANLKVKEAVEFQAGLFGIKINVKEKLKEYDLSDKANNYCSKLSGGQKQKMYILLASIHNPNVLFFDEISTGLDPVARKKMWNHIRQLKKQGKTIILSTHFMEEVEVLCDRAVLLNHGKIDSIGTVRELIETLPFKQVIEFDLIGDVSIFKKNIKEFIGISECKITDENHCILKTSKEFSMEEFENKAEEEYHITKVVIRNCNFDDYFDLRVSKKSFKKC